MVAAHKLFISVVVNLVWRESFSIEATKILEYLSRANPVASKNTPAISNF